MAVLLVVVAVTLLVSATCSLFEAALYSTRIPTLESARTQGRHASGAVHFLRLKRDIAVPTSAILILNTVANTAGATVAGMLAADALGANMVPVFSAVLTIAILFFAEILPKTYGATRWRILWPFIVWPLIAMAKVLRPLIWMTQGFSRLFIRHQPAMATTEDEIVSMIRTSALAGELNQTELALLTSVFRFDKMTAGQVMVPRRDVVYLDVSWSFDRCLAAAKHTRHTRYPLCREGLDEILGLIHVKDLLGLSASDATDLEKLARPLRRVPETVSLRRLMREMQSTQPHMAAVIDEHGTTVGIVTLENLLEQIVGEVRDEFDEETLEVVRENDGVLVVAGNVSITRIADLMAVRLPEADADTLSGLLVERVGRLLRAGDVVELGPVRAEVLEVRHHRAGRVRLTPLGDSIGADETTDDPA